MGRCMGSQWKKGSVNMKSLDELHELVVEWGKDRGILPYPDPMAQFNKTQEEVEELLDALKRRDREEVKDALGDIFVTLVMHAHAWNTTMGECVEGAYDVISKRTGKMVDGIFVKDDDGEKSTNEDFISRWGKGVTERD